MLSDEMAVTDLMPFVPWDLRAINSSRRPVPGSILRATGYTHAKFFHFIFYIKNSVKIE